ncbi:hypothetical protein BJF79_27325 [Actinomadura sp. CNU-125]|nr:hypothetical protein BJF79_27325 [Actinomadura sp. CNU-125]
MGEGEGAVRAGSDRRRDVPDRDVRSRSGRASRVFCTSTRPVIVSGVSASIAAGELVRSAIDSW